MADQLENIKLVLFDGVCNLCNHSVDFIIKHRKNDNIRFTALSSTFAQNILLNFSEKQSIPDAIILIHNEKIYIAADAVIEIAKELKFPFPILARIATFLPYSIRQKAYFLIAKYRYKIWGKNNTCRVPNEAEKKLFYT